MKILRVTSLGYESGGAENGMVLLKPVLEKMGYTVKVFSSNFNPDIKHFSDFEFTALEYQPLLLRVLYRIFYPHSFFALKKVLREYQPDIVQLHTMYQVSPSVLFLLRKYPTIVTVHGAEEYVPNLMVWAFPKTFFTEGAEEFVYQNLNMIGKMHYAFIKYITRPLYRVGLRNAYVFLVMSSYMQKEIEKEDIQSVCIPNATALFPESPLDVSKKTVLYAGRLEKIKGVQYLIRAFSNVVLKYPDAKLVIAGSGPYVQALENLVKSEKLSEQVQFVGHRTREELHSLYRESSIVCVPSLWPEPFGKVGLEAMSVGRPVIASDVGGISEWLIDGTTGFLVPPKDESALTEKILILFSDEELLRKMSKRAVVRAQDFSIETYATRVVALYEDAIAKQKQG
jgi:glycosyltransferase involved in cell wall biosynthesis